MIQNCLLQLQKTRRLMDTGGIRMERSLFPNPNPDSLPLEWCYLQCYFKNELQR